MRALVLFAIPLLMVFTAAADTVPILVCNTGMTAGCAAPNTFPSTDPNYSLIAVPAVGSSTNPAVTQVAVTGPTFATFNGDFPLDNTAWMLNDTISQWITPTSHQSDNVQGSLAGVNYIYETTFTLPAGFLNAILAGQWATDNTGIAIVLNGNDIGAAPISYGTAAFQSFTSFSANTQGWFLEGLNRLDFVVGNGNGTTDINGPSGLRVQFNNPTFEAVPEPATAGLLLLGVPLVWFLKRKVA